LNESITRFKGTAVAAKPPPNADHRPTSGVISLYELYTIDEAKRRLSWSDSAFRAAKRRGLAVLASGKLRYVTGVSILRFLEGDQASR
jgi:hypothetical protein